jgi:hypothetical protein
LPKNKGDISIEEKLKDQNSWQKVAYPATIHAAIVSGHFNDEF